MSRRMHVLSETRACAGWCVQTPCARTSSKASWRASLRRFIPPTANCRRQCGTYMVLKPGPSLPRQPAPSNPVQSSARVERQDRLSQPCTLPLPRGALSLSPLPPATALQRLRPQRVGAKGGIAAIERCLRSFRRSFWTLWSQIQLPRTAWGRLHLPVRRVRRAYGAVCDSQKLLNVGPFEAPCWARAVSLEHHGPEPLQMRRLNRHWVSEAVPSTALALVPGVLQQCGCGFWMTVPARVGRRRDQSKRMVALRSPTSTQSLT